MTYENEKEIFLFSQDIVTQNKDMKLKDGKIGLISESLQQCEKSQCLNKCFWQVCYKGQTGKIFKTVCHLLLQFFTKRNKKKRLKWEIYMCFEATRKVTKGPNLKISELWRRNEMLQDLWGVGVQWMCV